MIGAHKRTGIGLIVIVALLTAWNLAQAAPGDNLLEDPGFEDGPWPQSPAWPGEIASVPEGARSGERAGKLVATERDGTHEATIYSGYVDATVGLRYRFVIHAKGEGILSLRSIQLRSDPEDRYIIERPDNHMELSDEWQQIAIEIAPTDPLVRSIAAVVHLDGEGARAFLDDAVLTVMGLPGGELTVTPGYAMTAPGKSVSFRLAAGCDEGPITEGSVSIMMAAGGQTRRETVAITGETTTWQFDAPAEAEIGQMTVSFTNADAGVGATAWVDVVDAETWAQFDTAAQAAEIDTPAHILFLGDSLTDLFRGHNYTDMVGFWLQRAHGDVTYRNAGVGGDFITRVWRRMTDPENAYRGEMYDGLYEPTPTHVFIWLGHNDSKLKPRPEYESPEDYEFDPVVPLDTFEETFVQAIERIRENAPAAEITIVSASSSVHEICRDRVANRIAEGESGGSYFGKPDVLEQFNAAMQEIAQQTGSGYLDVYTPTKTHPDKPSLFTADGVHINDAGNRLVAMIILRYVRK
ncbi:MAG: GDSL-type esterase/lipase family protein [Armatimonadota bacterium]|nr:GDSL-type esterase/lipase family protein [Armatimonadota bacterium]